MEYDPSEDGKTHINVYSRGNTVLGRALSNFARTPIELPEGTFNSIEGYWYWLISKDDRLKSLYGFEAKKLGKELALGNDWPDDEAFKDSIRHALRIKVNTYPNLLEGLRGLKLPLTHYYVYGDRIIDQTHRSKWMLDVFEEYKNE